MKPHVVSSMIAYLIAQSVDVQLFHFWRRVTKGKHLSSYAFKVTFAALDTPLFYLGVHLLKDRVAATDELAAVA